MDQTQDELQAAINNIASGAAGAAGSDIVSQIENKVAGEMPTIETAAPAAAPAMQIETPQIEITPQKAMYGDPDLDRVKINALNEIRPILESVDIPFEKKFIIYKDIIELTDDKSCIEPAYNAARQIADEKTRAESLLYIIEIIDSLGIKMPEQPQQ